jgi:hypothetical protein
MSSPWDMQVILAEKEGIIFKGKEEKIIMVTCNYKVSKKTFARQNF